MASAGRILIIPKGDYDANSTYDNLDLVKYNGTSWLAKKTAKGIEPSKENAEYWQDVFDMTNAINNTLDIQSGTFNPTFYGATNSGTPTYTSRTGIYYKIGKLCYVSIRIALTSKGGATGRLVIGGLPFVVNAPAGAGFNVNMLEGVSIGNYRFPMFFASHGGSTIVGLWQGDVAVTLIDTSSVADLCEIRLSGVYYTE